MFTVVIARNLLSCGITFALYFSTASANFKAAPELQWTSILPNGETLHKGNAVVSSRDGRRLFVATAQGNFHIINGPTGEVIASYIPTVATGTRIVCESGVTLLRAQALAVYAVTDLGEGSISSRVLAINLRQATLEWEMVMSGAVVGSPVEGGVENNSAIYVTHNVQDKGQISVLIPNNETAGVVYAAAVSSEAIGPLGPPAVRTLGGKDVVLAAENLGSGLDITGGVYILLPSAKYGELKGLTMDAYEMRLATSAARSSVARPLLTRKGDLYLGQQGSLLSAWVYSASGSTLFDVSAQDLQPTWTSKLVPSQENADLRKSDRTFSCALWHSMLWPG
jgi:hypothetical protein